MRGWPWSGDARRFLANLPAPYIRPRDCYAVAELLSIDRDVVPHIWRELQEQGLIARTTLTIGRDDRKCYWERKP